MQALADSVSRDPNKRRKDQLQAEVVSHLWDEYLQHLPRFADFVANAPALDEMEAEARPQPGG